MNYFLLNISKYLLSNNINISDLYFNLENNTKIENNLFGYIFKGIKIINFSKDINLESSLTHQQLDKNYTLQKNENFKILFLGENFTEKYTIEFALVISDPSYEKMINFSDYLFKNNISSEEEIEYYNSSKKEYIGKTSYFEIIGMNELSSNCEDDSCDLCMENNQSECLSYKHELYNINSTEIISFQTGNSYSIITINSIINENYIIQILNERIQNGELINKNEIIYDNNRIYQISTLEEQKLNNNLNTVENIIYI